MEPTKAFITGSQVYGVPHPHSDVDLVVLVSTYTLEILRKFSDDDGGYGPDARSLRFGDLNLLCTTSLEHYKVWKAGTKTLKEMARKNGPILREDAIAFLANLRKESGITEFGSLIDKHWEPAPVRRSDDRWGRPEDDIPF